MSRAAPDKKCSAVNTLMFGDLWQLRPVSGTALCSNPAKAPTMLALHGLQLLWGAETTPVQKCWNFTTSLRCEDVWFQGVLAECRAGRLSDDNYFFLHGYPTRQRVRAAGCTCEQELSEQTWEAYDGEWANKFVRCGWTAQELLSLECEACATERRRRCRVMPPGAEVARSFQEKPFDEAPVLHAFNVPRYHALLLRAKAFAISRKECLTWSFAADQPLWEDAHCWSAETLYSKRLGWLRMHDQKTSHLSSAVALARGMPIRLTETINRKLKLFRGRRGRVVDWHWLPKTEFHSTSEGLIASELPRCVYVWFPGATWQISPDLGLGVYPMTPATRTWTLHQKSGAKVRRRSFFMIPDFAGTAHMMQGQSLEALFCDLAPPSSRTPSEAEHMAAYVMLSRARKLEHLVILRPFSRSLFQQGAPAGPRLLVEKFAANWSQEQVRAAWQRAEMRLPRRQDHSQHTCAACLLAGRNECRKPKDAFGGRADAELMRDGAWLRCDGCRTKGAEQGGATLQPTKRRRKAADVGAWRCDVCAEEGEDLAATRDRRAGERKRARVCAKCDERGLTPERPASIPCGERCGRAQGWRLLSPAQQGSLVAQGRYTCAECAATMQQKLRCLRDLMQKSKRQGCSCGKPAHAEHCVMSPRTYGERPYPGCDVMSREESAWLALQKGRRAR